MEGPVIVESCRMCKWKQRFHDWRDGDYDYCSHPKAIAVGNSNKILPLYLVTPEWCPVRKTA